MGAQCSHCLGAVLSCPEGGRVSVPMVRSLSSGDERSGLAAAVDQQIPCPNPSITAGLHQKGRQLEMSLSKSAGLFPLEPNTTAFGSETETLPLILSFAMAAI